MPLSTSSGGSPLTPLASDLSDVGSFSDSDWLDVASSDRGDSDAQAQDSDADSEAPIQDTLVTQELDNETNGLGLQLDIGPQAVTGSETADEPEESLAISSQSNDVSAESSVLFEAVDSLATITDSPATVPPPVADDAAVHDSVNAEAETGHAHNPAHDGLRLEFPDPLSSSEEIRMRAMIDSTSTISSWPDIRRDVAVTAATTTAVAPRHVNLHIAVLGHRPSPLRTQRITSLFVEAVADALGVSTSLAQGLTTPHSSGLRQFTFVDEATKTPQVYRIQVTDDSMDEDVVADKTLAMVFFSATRVLSTVPMLKRLPKDTLVVPLLHSASSAFTPSLLSQTRAGSQSLSASDDGWSAPSSVESSILVSSSGQDSHVRMQQLRIDAEFANLGVDAARILYVWPQRGSQFVVVPLHEVDRRSVFRGVREGLFPSAAVKVEEVEEKKPVDVPVVEVQAKAEKAEKVQQRMVNREHAWGAFAILSVLLAVLGSRVFVTSEPPPVFSKLPEMEKFTPQVTTTTSIATFVPPLPPSAAPIVHREPSLLSSSLRNLALSVAAAAMEEHVPVAQVPVAQVPAEAPPKVSTVVQESCPPAAPEATTTVEPEAPLTIDPPSFKSRLIPLLPGASFWSTYPQPIASTSKNVDNGETTEPDSVNAAFDALLSVLQRHVKDITKEVCLGETDSARSCIAAHQERATANARKIGRAAVEAAPDIADRILARHRRARKNARKVREQVTNVAVQVAEWTKVASEQMSSRRAARHERIQKRREKWRARRKAWEETHKEAMETTLCRSKVLCGLIGRDRGAV